MARFILALVILLLAAPAQAAEIGTREVDYWDGATKLQGFFAHDSVRGRKAAVLVVPEWWGLNDYARKRAKDIAKLGYAAMAVDMYGNGKVAETPKEAKALSGVFYADPAQMRRRLAVALEALKAQPEVDPARIAVIGYCFGGSVALEAARSGEDLKGVVSFHGGLASKSRASPGTVKAAVLVMNGGADKMVTEDDKEDLRREMQAAAPSFKMIDYPGALHAFTNPAATETGKKFGMPVAYDREADEKSFAEMREFLDSVLN